MTETIQDGVGASCTLITVLQPIEIFVVTDVEDNPNLLFEKKSEAA